MPSLTEQAQTILRKAKSVPVSRLTLAQFAESKRMVRIYSDVLDEEVVFAADNALVPDTETRIVYRARELALLQDTALAELRLLHEVKRCFGGEIEDDTRWNGEILA